MRRLGILFSLMVLFVWAGDADAQARRRSWGGAMPENRFELGAHGGYTWSFSRDVYYLANSGRVDIKDSGHFGFTLDINVRPGTQVELLYNRQNSTLQFEQFGVPSKQDVTGMSVEYFHIGGLYGQRNDKVMPYGAFTLGATRYAFKQPGVDDSWKFSLMPGLGVKYYAGDRIAIRLQGRLPITITEGGFGFACGGGGCYTSAGGSGNTQIDVGGGLAILF